MKVVKSAEVVAAQAEGRPIVALESTIFSTLGLPQPWNERALDSCEQVIRSWDCVPAVTAVIDGDIRLGLDGGERDRILGDARKMAERDIAVAVAQSWAFGASTVSASVAIASAGGVQVFATGGIGGVHRGVEQSGDVSADLDAIAGFPVVTVSAGAKAFLDLGRTLEYFETAGVPVLGWRHDWFPAFYTRSSGFAIPHRVETAGEVAAVHVNRSRSDRGMLVTVPIPESDELDADSINEAIARALDECARDGVTGPAVTPHVLAAISRATEGSSLPANVALACNNSDVAAQIARALVSG
ncbi:MAG: pseudouridine-5'-phosphate glycosidase [Actinomycetota bacterium]